MVDYGDDGMPVMPEEDVENVECKGLGMFLVTLIIRALFAGVAFLIYFFTGKDSYDAQIETLKGDGIKPQLAYLYLSAFVFSFTVWWVNFYPASFHKPYIMPGSAGNLRANMAIYKVNYQFEKAIPYVVMETEGEIGEYNRANRSMAHTIENMGGVLACIFPAGYVFPLPTFICTLLFATGRVLHQVGYTKGYGSHALGFAMAQVLGGITLEMMVLVAGILALAD